MALVTKFAPTPIRENQSPSRRLQIIDGSAPQFEVPFRTPGPTGVVAHQAEQSLEQALRKAFRLTRSEARVALLLAARQSNREIAEEAGVTEHTARRHTEKVLLKLGIHHRIQVREIVANRGRTVRSVIELC